MNRASHRSGQLACDSVPRCRQKITPQTPVTRSRQSPKTPLTEEDVSTNPAFLPLSPSYARAGRSSATRLTARVKKTHHDPSALPPKSRPIKLTNSQYTESEQKSIDASPICSKASGRG